MMRIAVASTLAAALLLAVAGCAEPRPLPTPTPTATETAMIGPIGDGVLRIGALLTMNGDVSGISPGIIAAIETAVRDINAAGGVLGAPVETSYRDAGSVGEQRLESGFAELVARGVDVVIGPSSPVLLERLLPLATEAGVAVIATAASSPTAGSVAPIDALLRTVPAVDREVVALLQTLVAEGTETVALVAGSDAQGQAVVDLARATAAETTTAITAVERADAATSGSRLSFSLAASAPDAVVVATTGLSNAKATELVTALLQRGLRGDQFWFTSASVIDYSSLDDGALEGATGVRAGAEVDEAFVARQLQSDPRLRTQRFAPETYDAVVLSALAATIAGDDGGPSILREFATALSGDVVCSSVGECLDVLDNKRLIDYDGLSGSLTLNESGDVASASLSLFRYDAANRPQREGAVSLAN